MNKKNPIIIGSLILTCAGFLTKITGFFFRIFLSRSIGAEGMGIYQLILPVFTLCHAFCCSGIEISISKYVAARYALTHNHKDCRIILYAGLVMSISMSIIMSLLLYNSSSIISQNILQDNRCTGLLKCLSFVLPLCSVHTCINGYYLGLKKALVPGLSLFAEQLVKTIFVYTGIIISNRYSISPTPIIAIYGMIAGETASSMLSLCTLRIKLCLKNKHFIPTINIEYFKNIFYMSYPVTLSRTMSSLLLNIEAMLIPACLKQCGYTGSEALSTYGLLTGMALPLVLFPASIITSISTMILPSISEAQATDDMNTICSFTEKTITFCLIAGIFCTFAFICYGHSAGYLLFANENVGYYITTLAWLCPFLYISITFGSILNGLGKTKATFCHNTIITIMKILFTIIFVPVLGIKGYLWGLLAGQVLICILHYRTISHDYPVKLRPVRTIILPAILALISVCISIPVYRIAGNIFGYISYPAIICEVLTSFTAYSILIYCNIHIIM